MDPKVLNNGPNYKTRTKPNLNGMGYTFKGRVPNMWALPTPNVEPKSRPKPINYPQSQPKQPLPLTQPLTHPKDTSPLTHAKNMLSPTQSPTKEVPKPTITSNTMSMDHPDQDKHTLDNGKPVYVSMGPDIAILEHKGSQSAVAVDHDLPILTKKVGLKIDLGSRPLLGFLSKDMALG